MARTNKILSLKECNNYHAPFDNYESKVALRVMPEIFPNNQKKEGAEISQKAQDWFSNEFDGLAKPSNSLLNQSCAFCEISAPSFF